MRPQYISYSFIACCLCKLISCEYASDNKSSTKLPAQSTGSDILPTNHRMNESEEVPRIDIGGYLNTTSQIIDQHTDGYPLNVDFVEQPDLFEAGQSFFMPTIESPTFKLYHETVADNVRHKWSPQVLSETDKSSHQVDNNHKSATTEHAIQTVATTTTSPNKGQIDQLTGSNTSTARSTSMPYIIFDDEVDTNYLNADNKLDSFNRTSSMSSLPSNGFKANVSQDELNDESAMLKQAKLELDRHLAEQRTLLKLLGRRIDTANETGTHAFEASGRSSWIDQQNVGGLVPTMKHSNRGIIGRLEPVNNLVVRHPKHRTKLKFSTPADRTTIKRGNNGPSKYQSSFGRDSTGAATANFLPLKPAAMAAMKTTGRHSSHRTKLVPRKMSPGHYSSTWTANSGSRQNVAMNELSATSPWSFGFPSEQSKSKVGKEVRLVNYKLAKAQSRPDFSLKLDAEREPTYGQVNRFTLADKHSYDPWRQSYVDLASAPNPLLTKSDNRFDSDPGDIDGDHDDEDGQTSQAIDGSNDELDLQDQIGELEPVDRLFGFANGKDDMAHKNNFDPYMHQLLSANAIESDRGWDTALPRLTSAHYDHHRRPLVWQSAERVARQRLRASPQAPPIRLQQQQTASRAYYNDNRLRHPHALTDGEAASATSSLSLPAQQIRHNNERRAYEDYPEFVITDPSNKIIHIHTKEHKSQHGKYLWPILGGGLTMLMGFLIISNMLLSIPLLAMGASTLFSNNNGYHTQQLVPVYNLSQLARPPSSGRRRRKRWTVKETREVARLRDHVLTAMMQRIIVALTKGNKCRVTSF